MICSKCGQDKPAHQTNVHMCVDCSHAIDSRLTYYRQHTDWLAEAREQGLIPWMQQPGETQWEYTVWSAYRDSYPGKRPTYSSVAVQLATTYAAVKKISQRWSFPARMQLWMAECDRITLLQRREEILDMNKEHVDMARTLRSKLNIAIEKIDPNTLKPGEIAALARLSTDMERKARIDIIAQEEFRKELLVDDGSAEIKKTQTKPGDLAEVVAILMKAGVLKNGTAIGIKETTTTTREVLAKGETEIEESDY